MYGRAYEILYHLSRMLKTLKMSSRKVLGNSWHICNKMLRIRKFDNLKVNTEFDNLIKVICL